MVWFQFLQGINTKNLARHEIRNTQTKTKLNYKSKERFSKKHNLDWMGRKS